MIKMKSVLLCLICALKINALVDPKEFKDYMATLLDNEKWVHLDSELRKQQKYCFFGNELSATNKPKVSIRIDDYVRQFYQKLKWFWQTTQNSTDEACLPGWERIFAKCYHFPKKNRQLNYWDAEKSCIFTYGGILMEPWDLTSNTLIANWLLEIFGHPKVTYWLGIDNGGVESGTKTWRYRSDKHEATFLNWAPGEPNDKGGNEDCVMADLEKNGQWNDINCRTELAYACEGPLIPKEIRGAMKPYSFAYFMAEIMTNDDWYALLKDLDIFEKDCAIGYMGSYHIDLPYILGLKPNSEEETYFYFQKARLYQDTEGIHKGPLALFMTNAMTGRLWTQLILTLNHQFSLCSENMQEQGSGIIRQRYLIEYIKNGDQNILHPLWNYITTRVSITNQEIINAHLDGHFDALAKYLNARMDDNGWKLLIEDTFAMEATCKAYLGENFKHISWPFYAGVSGNPMQAYQLITILKDMKINKHEN